jgi:hypothetical protein
MWQFAPDGDYRQIPYRASIADISARIGGMSTTIIGATRLNITRMCSQFAVAATTSGHGNVEKIGDVTK